MSLAFFGVTCRYHVERCEDAERLFYIFREFTVPDCEVPDLVFFLRVVSGSGRGLMGEIISPGSKIAIYFRERGSEALQERIWPDAPFPPLLARPFSGKYLVLHGCGVVNPRGRAIVFAAPSLAGKTSLLLECIRRGFRCIADDLLFIDIRTLKVCKYPKLVSIRESTLTLFPYLESMIAGLGDNYLCFLELSVERKTWLVHLDDLYPDCYADQDSYPIDYLVIPTREGISKRARLGSAMAAIHCIRNTCESGLDRRDIVRHVAALVRKAQSFILPTGDIGGVVEWLAQLS